MNWTCPFCNRPQTTTPHQRSSDAFLFDATGSKYGKVALSSFAVTCANEDCKEIIIRVEVAKVKDEYEGINDRNYHAAKVHVIEDVNIRPRSFAKPQPDCIPKPLRDDYNEACAIRDLSPKASATLARRCLQGMIRDFCGISRGRLIDEIKALRSALDEGRAPSGVTDEGVEAIDHVRNVGNIGAHMEKDINLIVDVDPGEAQALIELIEVLFDEWYVARHKRQERLARVASVAADKAAVIAAGKAAGSALPAEG